MVVAPLRLLMTRIPSLLKDCLQQCHYPLLPIYTLHELENDVLDKEFYAKVFVPAKTSPQGWFFIGPPMPTRDLAIQQVAYEALLRLRDLLPEMKEEQATRYLLGKNGFGAPAQVMISPEDEDPTLKYQIRFVNAGDYLLRHLTEAFLKARQDLSSLLVRTPILSHTDLACNTSYHFAASCTVFPRCRLTWPGTVCAFWLTYMIVSLTSI